MSLARQSVRVNSDNYRISVAPKIPWEQSEEEIEDLAKLPDLADADPTRFVSREELAEHAGILEDEEVCRQAQKDARTAYDHNLAFERDGKSLRSYIWCENLNSFDVQKMIGGKIFSGSIDPPPTDYARDCFRAFVNNKRYTTHAPEGYTSRRELAQVTGLTLFDFELREKKTLLFDTQVYEEEMSRYANPTADSPRREFHFDAALPGDCVRDGFVQKPLPGSERGVKPTGGFEDQEQYARLANTYYAASKRHGDNASETVSPWWLDEPVDREEFLREFGLPLMVKPYHRLDSEYGESGQYIGHRLYG